MAWIIFKTYFMAILSMVAFMCNPMAFPFVLTTVFLLWSTPYVIAAFMAADSSSDRPANADVPQKANG